MKAIVISEPHKLEITDIPDPRLHRESDIIIQTISGGICGSDIGIFKGTNSLAAYPRIIGHEYCGRIVERGRAVRHLNIGDVVAVDPVISCGHCYACRIGRPNVCTSLEVTGVHRNGGFSEFVSIPASNAYRIDTERIPEIFACLVEPYSIGAQCTSRVAVANGDKVLVMGSGPIGITAMQMAKVRGADVMMTDIIESRLSLARSLGADITVNVSQSDLAESVMDFTDNEGMPVVIDTVCSPSSFEQALSLACPASRVAVLGLISNPSAVAQVTITKKELSVMGSRLSNKRFPEVIQLFESGKIDPSGICSRTIPFRQAHEAMKLVMEQPDKVCKIVLTW